MAALPPIPRSISLAAGRIPVRRKRHMLDREQCVGSYAWDKRVIHIDAGLDVHAAWLTLRHERAHAVITDAGILMDDALEERICDALAAADVNEMLSRRNMTGMKRRLTDVQAS